MKTERVVWQRVRREARVCNLGHKHDVELFLPKFLGPVVGERIHDNGYEKRMTELRQDAQGRTYHMHVRIDYYNNVSWRRDEDGVHFWPRISYNGIDARTELC